MFRLKLTFLLTALLVVFMTVASVVAQEEPLRITLVINGVLGDKSFFDSAQRGMDLAFEDFDIEVNTIELGVDPANWESGLADAASDTDNYDLLIVGTFQMVDFMAMTAHLYPDKLFIVYDAAVNYGAQDDEDDTNDTMCLEGCTNVYSVLYSQNEGSFLAGVYAAAMSSQDIEGMTDGVVLGALGGQEIPVIQDFIVGYEQGACLVDPESQILVQYAGGNNPYNDPARGKEIGLSLYDQGADIIFQIAAGTGLGVFEAAAEEGRYAIGVDSDQATIINDTDPEQAARILTSMLKNVDNSLYRAVELYLNDELVFGEAEILGIAEGGVGLAVNDIYTENTPEAVQNLIGAVTEAITAGEITVNTVFASEETAATVGMGCENMPETDFDVTAAMEGM